MNIEIEIPRPVLTIFTIGVAVFAIFWSQGALTGAVGGGQESSAALVRTAEERMRDLRQEQQVLERREQILRIELAALETELQRTSDPDVARALGETRKSLIALIDDKRQAEREILSSLRQIWEAQAFAMSLPRSGEAGGLIAMTWPVDASLGISATFGDAAYEERFGLPHRAIDIPVPQGTVVAAAADGVIVKVSDNGDGFNSLVIRHAGGIATMYGHVSQFLVIEGQEIRAGDPVALSGGRPGSPGAGRLTTGPHLHFEVIRDGEQIDPLSLLSPYREDR